MLINPSLCSHTQLIELAMHIDYSGGVEVKIDADLVGHSHWVDTVSIVCLLFVCSGV